MGYRVKVQLLKSGKTRSKTQGIKGKRVGMAKWAWHRRHLHTKTHEPAASHVPAVFLARFAASAPLFIDYQTDSEGTQYAKCGGATAIKQANE